METGKSGLRKLLEISDKAAKEVLGEFYIVSESRMENYLQIMESGAEQIKSQEKELEQLRRRLADAETRLQGRTYCHSDQAVEAYVKNLEAKLADTEGALVEAQKTAVAQAKILLKQDCGCPCCERTEEVKAKLAAERERVKVLIDHAEPLVSYFRSGNGVKVGRAVVRLEDVEPLMQALSRAAKEDE